MPTEYMVDDKAVYNRVYTAESTPRLHSGRAALRGPVAGVITLDQRLDWSGDGRYDLDDPGDLQVLYQTVLNQAGTADQLSRWLNEEILRRIWHELWLPGRLRALWQARFRN